MPSRVLLHCLKSPIFHCSFILLSKVWRVFLISSAKSGNFHFLTSSPSSVALPKSSTFSFFFLLALFCSRRGDYLSNNLITNFHISLGYNFQIIFAFILRITQPFLPTCFYWLLLLPSKSLAIWKQTYYLLIFKKKYSVSFYQFQINPFTKIHGRMKIRFASEML